VTTIEAEICEEHARQAAFLWLLRDHAVRDTAYDLDELCALDDRLDAHLDGLRLAGDGGWAACRDLLAEAEGGEVFGAAVLAIDRWDLRGLAAVLDVGGGAPDLARGLASAFGFTPFERVQRLLPGLLAPRNPPALKWLGILASAVHRRDPGPALGYALLDGEPRLRQRALRAAGELGRTDLLPEIVNALGDEDEPCRFWASWSTALLGSAAAALPLWDFARGAGPFAERAASMALRRMDPESGYRWLYTLASAAERPRVPFVAAAALGDPTIVPWLIEQMADPALARLAGGALTMITGVDLAAEKLSAKAPAGFEAGPSDDPADENVAMDPDESLPWPDAARVATWWKQRAGALSPGKRYLLGQELSPGWLEEVLRAGNQQARAAAALELCVLQPGKALFEVRAPGHWQRGGLCP
jgi:uncharacterized protein (TIGR02270 family)